MLVFHGRLYIDVPHCLHHVCEDLAQIDNVAEVVRSVGPTVIYTMGRSSAVDGRRDMRAYSPMTLVRRLPR